ncbi:hypothetical protein KKH23_09305 [Patescibacteria group bacterium]|nr:hypothetical protein [Patescibacteria group bacterium]
MDIPEPPKAVQEALGMLQNLHKELDFLATSLSFYIGDALCMPDCGLCCHQSFTIPRLSGLYIAVAINTFPKDDRKYIIEQLEKWLLYELPDVRYHYSNNDGKEEEQNRLNEYRIAHRLSCPLISPDKKCLVYPWRDTVCRAYCVTRPAPKECPRPYGKGEKEGDRRFITSKDTLESRRATLKAFLEAAAPEWLHEYWMPTIVYAFLEPEKWKKLYKRIQQTKYAAYHSDRLWLITAEDVRDNVVNNPDEAKAIDALTLEPILIE